MKKISLITIILFLFIIPSIVFGDTINLENYDTITLEEIFEEEEIEYDFSSYELRDDAINIYLFYQENDQYSLLLLEQIKNVLNEYGEYFNVIGFKVDINNTSNYGDNFKLLRRIADFLNKTDENEVNWGVPFVVIGDSVYEGYYWEFESNLPDYITELYESKNRYDVVEEMNKNSTDEENNNYIGLIILIVVVVITILTISIVGYKTVKLEEVINE